MGKKLTIFGTYTCDPIEPYLEYWLKSLSIELLVEIAPYNQIFQSLLSNTNEASSLDVFLIRFQDWGNIQGENINLDLIEETAEEFINLLGKQPKSSIKVIIISPSAPLFQKKHANFFETLEDKINRAIKEQEMNILLTITRETLKEEEDYYDEYGDKVAGVPYIPEMYAKLATMIARKVFSVINRPPKVVVLDCDNTLWKGVCGEDGPENVQISPSYQYLQKFFKQLVAKGVVLCMSSKNYEQDVIHVFEKNPNMILTLDDFVTHRINWDPKSKNILSMSKELNLHVKDFIFIDDNAVECAEVSTVIPEIIVLNLPKEEENIQNFLDNSWQFDIPFTQTEEDINRTRMYKVEALRNKMKSEVESLEEFIKNLDLKITIDKLDEEKINRISQLTYRVNQFNLTGQKYSEDEIEKHCAGDYEWRYVHVSDKFGDYGIVGAMLFTLRENIVEIHDLYLSCRVLGRNVEHKILTEIASIGKNNNALSLKISYIETGRNQVALDFLKTLEGNIETYEASKKKLCLNINQIFLLCNKY